MGACGASGLRGFVHHHLARDKMPVDSSTINTAFLHLRKRAESADPEILVETFVDVGPLSALLSSHDHQILYGRRGTGKTHALIYLSESVAKKGDLPIYLDMRNTGSTGGIASDTSIPLTERATRLLADTLSAIHEALLNYSIENDDSINLGEIGPLLDQLADGITEVAVIGSYEVENIHNVSSETRDKMSMGITLDTTGAKGELGASAEITQSGRAQTKVVQSGEPRHRVHFGSIGTTLRKILKSIKPRRIWLILDEWSAVPIELQPYLADLIRRSIFPVQGITTKIGAVEHRSQFKLQGDRGDYIGIELGADASVDLNLDDFMVFDNDADRATKFFHDLIFRHYRSVEDVDPEKGPQTPSELISQAFTQHNTFEEFVRAAEGVPRDAIYILATAAQKATSKSISMHHVRAAARTWYQRNKESAVSANPKARALLHWIIDEVIGHRRARAFLLNSKLRHPLIDTLFDARVLHVLK